MYLIAATLNYFLIVRLFVDFQWSIKRSVKILMKDVGGPIGCRFRVTISDRDQIVLIGAMASPETPCTIPLRYVLFWLLYLFIT